MKKRLTYVLLFSIILLVSACSKSTSSSDVNYPTKPIDMLVAFAPGGSTDIVARAVAEKVSGVWEQPINVINKEGGAGTIGTVEAINAKPDGYTVLMSVTSAGLFNPAVDPSLPYEWDQFTFIARTNVSPLVVIVNAESDWQTLSELVEDIKKNPNKFTYGSSGPGGPSTFAVAQIMNQAGIDPTQLNDVVLGGGNAVVTSVAGGHIDFAVQNLSEVIELTNGGILRALAVSNDERIKALPDVPTAKEAGFDEFTLQGWNGVVAPIGFPDEMVLAWNNAIKEILGEEDFVDKMESLGLMPAYLDPEEFKATLQQDYDFAIKVVEQLQLQP